METVEASRTLRPPVTALTVFLPGGGGKGVSSPRPSALLSRRVCFGARSTMEAVPRRPSGFPPRFSPSKERGATWEAGGVQSASLPLMSRLSRLVSVDPREEMTDTSVAQRSFFRVLPSIPVSAGTSLLGPVSAGVELGVPPCSSAACVDTHTCIPEAGSCPPPPPPAGKVFSPVFFS